MMEYNLFEMFRCHDLVTFELIGIGQQRHKTSVFKEEIEELERLARIGRATEKILSTNDCGFGYPVLIGDEYGDLSLYSVEELLEWAGSEGI